MTYALLSSSSGSAFQYDYLKWGEDNARSDGGRVTWSLSLTGLTFGAGFTNAQFIAAAQSAFDAWEGVAQIDFEFVTGDADIDVQTAFLTGGTVGLASFGFGTGPVSSNDVAVLTNATIDMDIEPTWSPTGENGMLSYYAVLLHEIGHAIGLDHVDDASEIMNTPISTNELGDGDIAGVQVLYGSPLTTPFSDVIDLSGETVGTTLFLREGDDDATTTNQSDTVFGGAGNDTVIALGGDDLVVDVLGDNDLSGGTGDDIIISGGDGSVARGEQDDDILLGSTGDDDLRGGSGNDTLVGDTNGSFFYGNDILTAGMGTDFLQGGGGADRFVFETGDGVNTIGLLSFDLSDPSATVATGADFQSGLDLIDLRGFGYTSAEDAFAQVTDVDNTAQFSDFDTTIIFEGLVKDDLDAGDFWI